jgi:hypothetical protein
MACAVGRVLILVTGQDQMLTGVDVYPIHEIHCMVDGGSFLYRQCPKDVTGLPNAHGPGEHAVVSMQLALTIRDTYGNGPLSSWWPVVIVR